MKKKGFKAGQGSRQTGRSDEISKKLQEGMGFRPYLYPDEQVYYLPEGLKQDFRCGFCEQGCIWVS